MNHLEIANSGFGGCEVCNAEGFNHFVHQIDDRYINFIGPRGMEVWADSFLICAEAIQNNISKNKLWWDETNGVYTVEECAVHFDPDMYNICGFCDCSNYQGTRLGSGPDGDYIGSGRRPNWWVK